MVLTVSKETGCGDEVCAIVAEALKYKVVNNEITHYAALLCNMPPEKAKMLEDRNYSRRSAFMANNFDLSLFKVEEVLLPHKEVAYSNAYDYAETPSGDNFFQTIAKVVRMFANEDNIVIVGRGGNFVLKDHPDTLHLRFVAPLEVRAQNIAISQNITAKEGARLADESDVRKSKYMKHFFKEDTSDPANYDIIINLGKLSVDEAAKLLIGALKSR
jgi:cytidylate kinase